MDKREYKSSDLWAITTFFNPVGYQRRHANYKEFRKRLKVPLVAIELSFDGTYELDANDAEILIQLTGQDILWHKERLLNIAIQYLPAECDKVAWLDCDIIFGREDWDVLLRTELEKYQFVQIFMEACDLPKGFNLDDQEAAHALPKVYSSSYKACMGMEVVKGLRNPAHRSKGSSANGLAWAAPRSLLDKHGLYDACILGSGDRAMVCAALGEYDAIRQALYMNQRQFEHFQNWAIPFTKDLRNRLGYVDGTIYHLWHGNPLKRRLASRYKILKPYDFDPYNDIIIGENDCWEWVPGRKKLSDIIRKYFISRKEDD
jgi:hypothetical protein